MGKATHYYVESVLLKKTAEKVLERKDYPGILKH